MVHFKGAMAEYLLHGTLLIKIYGAEEIVTQDRKTGKAPGFIRMVVQTSENLLGFGKGYSQYYATVDLGKTRVGRTRVLEGNFKDPEWNETFSIFCAHTVSHLVVSIKDAAVVGTAVIGRARIPAIDLLSGKQIEDWYPLHSDSTGHLDGARLRFSVQFTRAIEDQYWGKGILDRQNPGLPFSYFPQKKGCRVTLYQDAHVTDNFLPPIYLGHDQIYQPCRCWEDMFDAIHNAKHIIYITGWSVYTEFKLCRDPQRVVPGDEGLTLGELLKRKADQGVRVNLMVWDDRSSNWGIMGQMATHDEETANYFKGTGVNCFLCPRSGYSKSTVLQTVKTVVMFTHHQKSLIVDASMPSDCITSQERRLVSFVGGLDLCDGRYDDQYHSLFRTLDTVHSTDFHNGGFAGASIEYGGPREPWHDIHCKLEGPIAWDVLYNFEQRWRKQAGESLEHLLSPDAIERGLLPIAVTLEDDLETWNVQLFRSIDAGAAFGFSDDTEKVAKLGLVSGKDNTIDRSIQNAYIHAIRCAKNFIYIENQYFVGSSFGWDSSQEVGANNLIPMELVRKIASKIEAGERFSVYIVIPLYPEGYPSGDAVQAILRWQQKTFQMMYKEIANSLRLKKRTDLHPKDYLSVFCLGNRETILPNEYAPTSTPQDLYYKSAQENRRFMIYVHSKMMIVDDEYIIVGSANINERSLNGSRDSEIAMGAYQPYYLATNSPATGQIHGFRMALWFEHMGYLDNYFLHPSSLECIRKVNHRGDELWSMFSQKDVVDLPGHLMTYPYSIGRDGSVSELRDAEYIPDTTDAKVFGRSSYKLPVTITS